MEVDVGLSRAIKRVAFFPDSPVLAERWWHRLATVVFWALLVILPLAIYRLEFVAPFDACHRLNDYKALNDLGNRWDCGTNAIAYAISRGDGLLSSAGAVVIAIAGILMFSALYRVALYVALGKRWKGS